MTPQAGRTQGLGARFDNAALHAYEMPAPPVPDWPSLRAWCLANPALRLAWAAPATEDFGHAARRAHRLALELDGSHALQACSGKLARLRLRWAVKWQDLRAGDDAAAALPATRIWDSGRARDAAAAARFVPRRPTFVVIDQGPAEAMHAALAGLQVASGGWRHPVRVLWLLPQAALPGAVPLAVDG